MQGRGGFFGGGGVDMVGVVGSVSPLRRGGCAAVCWVFDRERKSPAVPFLLTESGTRVGGWVGGCVPTREGSGLCKSCTQGTPCAGAGG